MRRLHRSRPCAGPFTSGPGGEAPSPVGRAPELFLQEGHVLGVLLDRAPRLGVDLAEGAADLDAVTALLERDGDLGLQ